VRTELDALLSVQRWAGSFLPEPWDVRRVLESGEEPARPYALIEYLGSADTAGAPAMQDVTVAFTLNLYLPEAESRQAADDVALALRETVWLAAKIGPNVRRPTTDLIPLFSYEPRPAVQRVRVRDATAGTFTLALDTDETGPIAFDADAAEIQAALDAALPAGVTTQVLARGRGVFDVHFGGTLLGAAIDLLDIDTASLTGPGTVTELLRGAPAPWRSDRDFMRVTSFGQTTLRDPDNPKLAMVAVDLRCAFTRGLPVAWDAMLLQSVTVRDKLTGAH
jgi:hypothetical protein